MILIELHVICCSIVAPSRAPDGFNVAAKSSTSITASWQLPPLEDRNGIIRGFKLFYKKEGSSGPQTMKLINNKVVRTTDVSGLSKYTKYEFQVLAFTSVGDGPNSTVKSETTKEDGKKLVLIISKFHQTVLQKERSLSVTNRRTHQQWINAEH